MKITETSELLNRKFRTCYFVCVCVVETPSLGWKVISPIPVATAVGVIEEQRGRQPLIQKSLILYQGRFTCWNRYWSELKICFLVPSWNVKWVGPPREELRLQQALCALRSEHSASRGGKKSPGLDPSVSKEGWEIHSVHQISQRANSGNIELHNSKFKPFLCFYVPWDVLPEMRHLQSYWFLSDSSSHQFHS